VLVSNWHENEIGMKKDDNFFYALISEQKIRETELEQKRKATSKLFFSK